MNWNWGVTKISDHEFTPLFPDPASLRFGTPIGELTLTLNKLTVNISVPEVDPLVAAVLEPVWVQIRGVPPIAKQIKVIRKMSQLLGKILEVDEASLFKTTVRVKLPTHDSSKLQTIMQIFFNRAGYNVRISVEDTETLGDGGLPPDAGHPGPKDEGGVGTGRDPPVAVRPRPPRLAATMMSRMMRRAHYRSHLRPPVRTNPLHPWTLVRWWVRLSTHLSHDKGRTRRTLVAP
ncbi:hypothetical protein ZWY2020_037689 [Hordeum vulgare]|nr:hypothetical protein ZWY2020_037689 [Hordeum vulgare]